MKNDKSLTENDKVLEHVAKTEQDKFDEKYISSSEICNDLSVKRSTLLNARRRGYLPGAIQIKGVRTYIWEREKIMPYLDSWTLSLASRRGELR